jgi:hypothetical protein
VTICADVATTLVLLTTPSAAPAQWGISQYVRSTASPTLPTLDLGDTYMRMPGGTRTCACQGGDAYMCMPKAGWTYMSMPGGRYAYMRRSGGGGHTHAHVEGGGVHHPADTPRGLCISRELLILSNVCCNWGNLTCETNPTHQPKAPLPETAANDFQPSI